MKEKLTNTEWEVCECLWEESPLTMTQIAARLTELSAGQLTMVPAGEEYLPGPREE